MLVTTDPDVAIDRLRSGGLVAIPTETVYGLAARAEDPDAVRRVFSVKQRPADHPLILHLHDGRHLERWAKQPSEAARALAAHLWPGPLTLLVERDERVDPLITGGRDTVAIRVPQHPLAQRVIAGAGPLVAPSANPFGQLSPTTAAHVVDGLGELLDPARDAILDGGPCTIGVESTIVDCTVWPPQILRPGGVTAEEIATVIGVPPAAATGPARASGMLASHYAPRARVLLVDDMDMAATTAHDELRRGATVAIVDFASDPPRAAQRLYAELHTADTRGITTIVAVVPIDAGIGRAVRDRLTRAAAERPTNHPSRGR